MYPQNCDQKFVWFAEWLDGARKQEFDGADWIILDFQKLRRQMLSRFGLLGEGRKIYYDVSTGDFNIDGIQISISYGEYDFSKVGRFEDVISYKEAHSNFRGATYIDSFNFGYKRTFVYEDVKFSIKFIYTVPHNEGKEILTIHIVADKDMQQSLCVKQTKDGKTTINKFSAPLKAGYGGKINLEVSR